MSYAVHANKRPWKFATEAEARAAANDLFQRKGLIVAITRSNDAPTHEWKG